MKIDEKSKLSIAELQIREQLRFVNWMHFLHDLQFNEHHVLHQHIEAIADTNENSVIEDGERYLEPHGKSSGSKLVCEAGQVRALEQAGAKGGVHLDGRVHNLGADVIDVVIHSRQSEKPRAKRRTIC